MTGEKFKPMLAIDATNNLEDIKYPKLASYKLDGIRCIFHPELGMVARSFKPIQNKQLNEKFAHLVELSKDLNIILDGEMYGHSLSFQAISRAVMTQDFTDEKTIKKLMKEFNTDDLENYVPHLIGQVEYHCFDTLTLDNQDELFLDRWSCANKIEEYSPVSMKFVAQITVENKEDVEKLFKFALDDGYEGLILRDPVSPYKFGRSTLKEEYLLKVKPFKTFDVQVTGVVQGTEVDPTAEKTTNELGRSVTSKKKDDRILVEKASAFVVKYEGHELKVSLAMTDGEKEEVWKNRESYIGRMIEYKGMMIGAKDVPRHPVFVRFRDDRE